MIPVVTLITECALQFQPCKAVVARSKPRFHFVASLLYHRAIPKVKSVDCYWGNYNTSSTTQCSSPKNDTLQTKGGTDVKNNKSESRKSQVASRRSQVASRKSQVASRKSQVASGKWQVASGKWQVASRKWQVASRKSQVAKNRGNHMSL